MKCKCSRDIVARGLCATCYYRLPEQSLRKSEYEYKRGAKVKVEVLTHYGKQGKLMCCWAGCSVHDIDMLTLDHLNDDGGKHLSTSGRKLTGTALYTWAKAQNFPALFQTLCGGHQFKKAIIKRNKEREVRNASNKQGKANLV